MVVVPLIWTLINYHERARLLAANHVKDVRSADGRLFALDAKDGRRRWLYQRSSPPLSVRSPVGMVADRGYLLTGFAGGKLVSIALANGNVRWEATVADMGKRLIDSHLK